MDETKVDDDLKEIKDTLQNEFPDLDVPQDSGSATGKAFGKKNRHPGARPSPSNPTKPQSVANTKATTTETARDERTQAGRKATSKDATGPPKQAQAPAGTTLHQSREEKKGFEVPPALTAMILTVLISLFLARRAAAAGSARTSEETLVGLLFILGSALTLVFSVKADKAAHEIQDVLFGVAVMVPQDQQRLVTIVGVAFMVVYLLMFKDFLFVSFDPVVATVAGFPIGWANAILFVLIAVVISVCTRAVGAMPVFALTILPPTAALQIHDRIVPAAITSALLGGFCAGAGYFATGIWELPVGPCIVLAAAIPAFVAWSIRRLLHWNVIRGERRQTIQS
jgi:zinc transport system permease protein